MNTTLTPASAQLLVQPLAEFCDRLSAPTNLSRTLNRLLFDSLRLGGSLQPDEAENLNALLDFLLACQLASGPTVIVAEA